MSRPVTLTMTTAQHEELRQLLYPGDGKEAVAIGLCGVRTGTKRCRLLVREFHGIPTSECSHRSSARVTWSTDRLVGILDRAEQYGLSVVKFHSHPSGHDDFSEHDDQSDQELLPAFQAWVNTPVPHASCVMLPSGRIFGRALEDDKPLIPISIIAVVGDDLTYWPYSGQPGDGPAFLQSQTQAFGRGTTSLLSQLSIGIVGCSGTGGPVIEMLHRLGAGELVLVDNDHVEDRNLNRIPHATAAHAQNQSLKVSVLGEAVEHSGLGTLTTEVPYNLSDVRAIEEVAQCDVVFGCMDTVEGRYILNRIASYYSLPYIDVGVRLEAKPIGEHLGKIEEVCAAVNYLQPGGSSLLSRGVITMEGVRAESLKRTDPAAYRDQVKRGYIRGVNEDRPAVNSVNMLAASLGVNELLARIHPYREDPNSHYASTIISLASMETFSDPEGVPCGRLKECVGIGDSVPLLGLPGLTSKRAA